MLSGMATGFGLFYRLVYILGISISFSYVMNWLSLISLTVEVERRTKRVRVGDDIDERITIRNLSKLPKPVIQVEDLTNLPGYFNGMALTLTSNEFRSWRTKAPARKRGVYIMGPVRVSSTDSLGLFRRERTFCETSNLVVYPRTYSLPKFRIHHSELSGESSARKRSYNLTPHVSTVRNYTIGDSITRIHWNSTARTGKLMSKEFDNGLSSDVWILVDLHKDIQAGHLEESTDEYSVSIGASLAKKYLEAELPVGLISYGDQRYHLPAETGHGQFNRTMEVLAMSKATGAFPLDSVLIKEDPLWSYHSSLVIITPSHRVDWITPLNELIRRRVRVAVVLLDGPSFGGALKTLDTVPMLSTSGISPYVVKKGDDISTALSYTATDLDMMYPQKPGTRQ